MSLSLLFVYVPTTLVWSTLVSAGRVRIPRRDLLVTRSRRGIASRINTTKCFLTNQLAEYAAWRRYRGPLWQYGPVIEVYKTLRKLRISNFKKKTSKIDASSASTYIISTNTSLLIYQLIGHLTSLIPRDESIRLPYPWLLCGITSIRGYLSNQMTCTHVSQPKDKAPGIEESMKSIGTLTDSDSNDGSRSNLDPPSLQRSIYRAKMVKNNRST